MKPLEAILLVEDNDDDVFLMKRALASAGIRNPLFLAEDGQEAINYLAGAGKFADRAAYPVPTLLFLDLKLPIKNGFSVLAWLREQPQYSALPVVILSSSSEPSDTSEAQRLGANAYLAKPPTSASLREVITRVSREGAAG